MDLRHCKICSMFPAAAGDRILSCEVYMVCWQRGKNCIQYNMVSTMIGASLGFAQKRLPGL